MVDVATLLVNAFATLFQLDNFLVFVLAVLIGVTMGAIPGLNGIIALALLVPFTFGLEPTLAFMVLAGTLGGVNYGGSITAILLNTPGTGSNAATLLDGFPMTRQGRSGEALAASATASALGAMFGVALLLVLIPLMIPILLLFTPVEIFWLAIWGLIVVASVMRGNMVPSLIAGGLGLILGAHGMNTVDPGLRIRWDYGLFFLQDGFKLVPVIVGLFAVTEMINLLYRGQSIADVDRFDFASIAQGRRDGIKSVFEHKFLFLRSALIGTFIGIVPGVGGLTANYFAYFQAVKTSKNPESFGTGDVRGVIAAEAANDAKDGGALLPTLALGIPGSISMAVLFSAFALHGMVVGPTLLTDHTDIVVIIIVALLVSNVITSVAGLAMIKPLSRTTVIDIRLVAPLVIVVSFMASYAVSNNIYDLFLTLFFGILGFIMIYINSSRIPLIMGIVLGPIAEKNMVRSLQISSQDFSVFVRSPISILLILLIVFTLALPYVQKRIRSPTE